MGYVNCTLYTAALPFELQLSSFYVSLCRNSFLEEDSLDIENPYRFQPVGIFLNTECSSMPVDSHLTGIFLKSQSIVKNSSCMGSSKYVKTSSFPIEMGDMSDDYWDKKEDFPPSHFTPSDYEGMEGSPTVKVCDLSYFLKTMYVILYSFTNKITSVCSC